MLRDCGLLEIMEKKDLTSAERAIRHGEMQQLKQLKKAHKMEAPRKRKLLTQDSYQTENPDDEERDSNEVDIREVEFRMSHDSSAIQVNS